MNNSMSFQSFGRAKFLETEQTLKFCFFVYFFVHVILFECLKAFVALNTGEGKWLGHPIRIRFMS